MRDLAPRVADTPTLLTLARNARRHKFNRQLPLEALERHLDPDGRHVVSIALWGHNLDRTPINLHHRCQVLAKVKDSPDPMTLWLDLTDQDWRDLEPAERTDSVGSTD